LYSLLERFDIGIAHAPVRESRKGKALQYKIDAPDSFPEFNTGVVVYKKNNLTENLFYTWLETYKKIVDRGLSMHDQPAFREAVWYSDVRVATLTPEYNFRLGNGKNEEEKLLTKDRVKVIHGRHPDLSRVAKKINANYASRIVRRKKSIIQVELIGQQNGESTIKTNRERLDNIQKELEKNLKEDRQPNSSHF
jgi:hypothetical protein